MEGTNIEKLVADVLESRKHANKLAEIIEYINPENKSSVKNDAVNGAVKIFSHIFSNRDVSFEAPSEGQSTLDQYKGWIGDKFLDCYNSILACLIESDSQDCKNKILVNKTIEMLKLKATFMNTLESSKSNMVFPEKELSDFIKTIFLCADEDLFNVFIPCFKFDDFRYFMLKVMPPVLAEMSTIDKTMNFIFKFLETVAKSMPCDSATLSNSFIADDSSSENVLKNKVFDVSQQRKMFSRAWLEFLKCPLSGSVHKKVLIILHTCLIPNFSKPRLLADFLMRSFSRGGGLALLGLNGLFVLMHYHNLEYPDFYKNLCSMLHPRIFETKYAARFFHLLQLFLSSTHIPAYLVAAFVKKMARLCLVAPPPGIQIMLALIMNLLRQHPNIRHLINNQSEDETVIRDPFLEKESDPANCNALESSLWEIRALSKHYFPDIAKAATLKSLHSEDLNVDELLEVTYSEMISFDKTPPATYVMNHMTPTKLIGGYEDSTSELWDI